MLGAAAKVGVVAKHVATRGAAAKKEERRGEGRSGDVEWGGGERRGDGARRRGATQRARSPAHGRALWARALNSKGGPDKEGRRASACMFVLPGFVFLPHPECLLRLLYSPSLSVFASPLLFAAAPLFAAAILRPAFSAPFNAVSPSC